MKYHALVFLAAFSFLPIAARAGTTSAPADSSSTGTASDAGTPFPCEFDLQDTYVGSGDVTRGSRTVRDFDENNFAAQFVFTPRVRIGILRIGATYERYDFDVPRFAQLPDTLQGANLVLGLDTELSPAFLIRIETRPGFYSARQLSSDDFNLPFIIGGTYIYSSNVQFVFGVGVDFQSKYPVVPGGGIRWRLSPQWLVNAVLPNPRLEFEATRNLTFYVGAEIKSGTFRVADDFGDSNGPRRLNHAVLSYSEIRTGGGIEWKVSSAIKLSVEGGYQPYRNFDYQRADIRYHQDGGAPYGTVALHGAF